jgi:hypothetical protein
MNPIAPWFYLVLFSFMILPVWSGILSNPQHI